MVEMASFVYHLRLFQNVVLYDLHFISYSGDQLRV